MMARPRNKNLNERTILRGRQSLPAHTDFYFRSDGLKMVGKEDDVQECVDCHIIFPFTAFASRGMRRDGACYHQTRCRQCSTKTELEARIVRKNAPPPPNLCNCCHKESVPLLSLRNKHKKVKLQADHVHGTTTFRGWICRKCNTGMGNLGDDLEGILQAAVYLEKDENKIIETLHKVFNEMFARTK
tara:strand:- start:40 stop:600 length:561 start_codon:yes stop_codon:yes gene_type:complete